MRRRCGAIRLMAAMLESGSRKPKRSLVNGGGCVVMLLPARTDTKWFHDYIYNQAEIRFVRGRLKFGESQNSAPFPSMVVVFRSEGANG